MSKKILVVSDNHGNRSNLEIILDEWKDEVDALVHCGDSEIGPEYVKGLVDMPVYYAQGNCDFGFENPDDLFEFEGHVCYVTHGHRYGANWGDEGLVERAQEMGADILIFGHTHIPAYREYKEEHVTLFNPGSVALPRQYPPEPTFMILEFMDDGTVEPHFYCLDDE